MVTYIYIYINIYIIFHCFLHFLLHSSNLLIFLVHHLWVSFNWQCLNSNILRRVIFIHYSYSVTIALIICMLLSIFFSARSLFTILIRCHVTEGCRLFIVLYIFLYHWSFCHLKMLLIIRVVTKSIFLFECIDFSWLLIWLMIFFA